jgi:prepilin-type N-terminal cleavage/methylation domain-containing protein
MSISTLTLTQATKQANRSLRKRLRRAFTLVELLLVVAIISILAAMVISHFGDASLGAKNVVAQQQLAVWQSALNNWVNSKIGKIDTTIEPNGSQISINTLANYYNGLTRHQRFLLLTGKNLDGTAAASPGYLEGMTADHFITTINEAGAGATTAKIYSGALKQTNQWLELPQWNATSFPQVKIYRDAANRTVPAATSTD